MEGVEQPGSLADRGDVNVRAIVKVGAAVAIAEEQRATVFKRMVTAMQDNQFNWRTVERLAIVSGVDESEAHEILAEHPNEVVLGKSQDGKLLAKLAPH